TPFARCVRTPPLSVIVTTRFTLTSRDIQPTRTLTHDSIHANVTGDPTTRTLTVTQQSKRR
ncbi:hypothetical protein IW139_006661, partial [Coemansia sp. RSA 353]